MLRHLSSRPSSTLAKFAATNDVERHNYVVYGYDIRADTKHKLFKSWSAVWAGSSKQKGVYYATIQPDIRRKPWFAKFSRLSRHTVSSFCRIRLGHCSSPVFLRKIRVRDNPLCECGFGEGTLDHIFFSCQLNSQSFDLYNSLSKIQIPLPINFHSLLTYFSPKLIKIISKFINENNIKV
uniref:SFRICE_021449 n=1 Tax=Spodoptera frugiperda TaxID=7108 RepID=A0A2H1VIH2_SPOFR